jgi:PPK2 family polyphosphate:nucleotide phosphotransferase
MKIDPDDFRVKDGKNVNLKKWPTDIKSYYESKKQFKEALQERVNELSELQNLLYAANRFAVLLIFQAMDAAGKDGAIKHVMSGGQSSGLSGFQFQAPKPEELDHDFLWRTTRNLPERGRIGIFNRSYYEEVLIVRVHKELLQGGKSCRRRYWTTRISGTSVTDRFAISKHISIETVLESSKFFLHVSKEEQRKRFLARIDEPEKNWKFNRGDIEEREFWSDYMAAYEACLEGTSTRHSPWFIVPADDKQNTRLIISEIILHTLRKLKMKYPVLDEKRRNELRSLRKLLEK